MGFNRRSGFWPALLAAAFVLALGGGALTLYERMGPARLASIAPYAEDAEHRKPDLQPADYEFYDARIHEPAEEKISAGRGDEAGPQPILAQASPTWPPSSPLLRIEAEQHTASLRAIDVDAAGRYMVTASHDKTARVWAIPQRRGEPFRLLRVLRPPIGDDNEGKIFSVAISPDGKLIAVGGWLGKTGSASDLGVYLFDRASGSVVARLSLGANVWRATNSLAFSPGGRLLAAGTTKGVVVWARGTSGWGASQELQGNYGEASYGLSFAEDGRLAVASTDGVIRLYGADLSLRRSARSPGGKHLHQIAFSPDGRRLAVGYVDTAQVSVFNAADLNLAFAASTGDVQKGYFSAVAWSADGTALFAGGTVNLPGTGRNIIRRFGAGGRGTGHDIPVSEDAITGIAALPDGRIAYGAADPVIGVLDTSGAIFSSRSKPIIDLRPSLYQARNSLKQLRLSRDGASISLPYEYNEEDYLRFDAAVRSLTRHSTEATDLAPPRHAAPGINVTNWFAQSDPSVNAKPLRLQRYERAHALAIAPAGGRFIVGTDWYLRAFDADGKELWRTTGPGVAWRVNISGDGRLAVAAFGDGTIRWYRMDNGRELLALFVAPDRNNPRWIAWTPQGYYDASPGAEDLIGWHVNQGRNREALFYRIAKFRDRYYRPDVIARVLPARDVQAALNAANAAAGDTRIETAAAPSAAKLPPRITVLSPVSGSNFSGSEATLHIRAQTPAGGALYDIETFVDGRRHAARGIGATPRANADIPVKFSALPPRDITLGVRVVGADGASEVAEVLLHYVGPHQNNSAAFKPTLYVVAIGVSDYDIDALDLDYAHQDALDFERMLARQKGAGLYSDVKTRLLTNKQAKRGAVLDALTWLEREVTSRDVAMLFIAGHGFSDSQNRYYFLPSDGDPGRLRATGVDQDDLRSTLETLGGRLAMVFLDTCYSGSGFTQVGSKPRSPVDTTRIINELSDGGRGAVVFSSAQGFELAVENSAWRNGAFTEALIHGLEGKADLTRDNVITIAELEVYVTNEVKQLTSGQQKPVLQKPNAVPDTGIFALQ